MHGYKRRGQDSISFSVVLYYFDLFYRLLTRKNRIAKAGNNQLANLFSNARLTRGEAATLR